MEIKLTLNKPYIFSDKMDFITECNKQGYEVKEDDDKLYALGLTEEEKSQKEKERIAMLSLTKREVFLALYKAKGITPEQIKAQITDTEALIEFEYANEYYRGNPLIDLIGAKLGYSSDDLDYLFKNKELPKQPIDDVIEATEEAELYTLPDVSLVDTSDSAEDLNPSAVIKKDLEKE